MNLRFLAPIAWVVLNYTVWPTHISPKHTVVVSRARYFGLEDKVARTKIVDVDVEQRDREARAVVNQHIRIDL